MPAIEIMIAMKDQKPAGTNAALPGKISAGSSKSAPPNVFLGMMQLTVAEYKNQTEENIAFGYDDNQIGKIFLIKNDHSTQNNGKSKRGEENAYPGEILTMSADDNSTDALNETIATPAFISAFIMDKMIGGAKAVGADEVGANAFLPIQKEGKKGLVSLKELLLNVTADNLRNQHKDILASLTKKSHSLTEANLNTTVEMKNQMAMAREDKGLSAVEIQGILKAVEDASFRFMPADQSLRTINQREAKNELVKAMEGKGLTADVVAGIIEELDQIITKRAPEVKQDTTGNAPINVEPLFKQAAVAIFEDKGFSAEEIKGILKAVEDTSLRFRPADQLLQMINQREVKNELVKAMEGKGLTADVVAGIIEELDQIITKSAPEVKQDTTGNAPINVEPLFKQAAVAIFEKKGFSADEIKGILNIVEQATTGGLKADVVPRSNQPILVQQSFYNKDFMKEATVGKKKIHTDIYRKEASFEDFRHENVESQIKINPPENQTVKEGIQKELIEQPENNQQSGKKNIFPGVIRGTDNKQSIASDKEITTPQIGKIIKATDQDNLGKWSKLSGDATAKTSQTRHEDVILSAGREQPPLTSNILSMAPKSADFHGGRTTMDTSRSIYQSVLDQVQESFSIAQNKDNGQVRLTLKPEIMGHLDMQITVRNETVQIMMTVENEKVHQAMNAHIDDLKTAMQNQGMKIDKIEIALQYKPDQERTFYQDQTNSGFNNPGQNTRHERMLNQELFMDDEHYPKSGQDIIKTQNSMQGVSVFA